MNSDLQQVVNTCISLDEVGKKPSVGMIKAKLLSPLPIPTIIKGLSYWKDNKNTVTKQDVTQTNTAPKASTKDLATRVSVLESEVASLRAELKRLRLSLAGEGSE
ncbi:hypothetical protein [Glaciecola sp. MF2-115]|uniref:hypothetical protein n=1 Tax=Glaciecola sp. MF2-115 TaxID=3384827 RepID=UPI00399F6330